jgi:hypothetical protein
MMQQARRLACKLVSLAGAKPQCVHGSIECYPPGMHCCFGVQGRSLSQRDVHGLLAWRRPSRMDIVFFMKNCTAYLLLCTRRTSVHALDASLAALSICCVHLSALMVAIMLSSAASAAPCMHACLVGRLVFVFVGVGAGGQGDPIGAVPACVAYYTSAHMPRCHGSRSSQHTSTARYIHNDGRRRLPALKEFLPHHTLTKTAGCCMDLSNVRRS